MASSKVQRTFVFQVTKQFSFIEIVFQKSEKIFTFTVVKRFYNGEMEIHPFAFFSLSNSLA